MPNRKTIFAVNNFYHLFSRGDRREVIFKEPKDYLRFLEKLEEYRIKYNFDLITYCLIPNHFHLLVKQLSQVSVSKFLGVLLNSYARYCGIKYELPPGHLFQGNFGAKLIDSEASLIQVSRYIHLNPVKNRLLSLDLTYKAPRRISDKKTLRELRNYPWSSYPFYLGRASHQKTKINPSAILETENNFKRYRKFVESKLTDEDLRTLEKL